MKAHESWLITIAILSLGYLIHDIDVRIKKLEKYPQENVAYVFVCKNMPQHGQLNWQEWLKKKGNCEMGSVSSKQ